MKILKFSKPYQRLLRYFRRIAQVNHGRCPICNRDILPGEEYECSVYISSVRGFYLDKAHWFCPEDFWEEQVEEERRLYEWSLANDAALAPAAAA